MPVTGDGRADADTAYFDSKEAVFAEVAQQVVETMMEGLHTELRPGYRPGGADPAGRQSFVDRSARGIRRMQADGIADPELDPVIMAEILGAMVDQTCYIWFFLGKEFDPAAVVESLTTAWARTIGIRDA
jgi:AcrR family transcriptional regulator